MKQKIIHKVEEDLKAVTIKITAFWDSTLRSMVFIDVSEELLPLFSG
jgi:hypothetical protein